MGVNQTNTLAGQTSSTALLESNSSRANIEFYNINSKGGGSGREMVIFKGFLTSFNDTYNVNFNEEAAYGRMDPFRIYQNTVRTLSLAWDIPAWDADEARANLVAASELIKMLYPSYGKSKTSSHIEGSPIVRLKFANLICHGDGMGDVKTAGLAGFIPNLVITPVVEQGYFEERQSDRSEGAPKGLRLYPKLLQMNCSFNVIHEQSLGWNSGKHSWRSETSFPYGVGTADLGKELSPEFSGENQYRALPGSIAGGGSTIEESDNATTDQQGDRVAGALIASDLGLS